MENEVYMLKPVVNYNDAISKFNGIIEKQQEVYSGKVEEFSAKGFSNNAFNITFIAEMYGFKTYEWSGKNPTLFLFGFREHDHQYDLSEIVESLDTHGIFDSHKLILEAYQGKAALLRKNRGRQSLWLEEIFNDLNLSPEGNDDFNLYEEQQQQLYILDQSPIPSAKVSSAQVDYLKHQAVFNAMQAFVKRQKKFLVPHILDNKKSVCLLDLWQVLSIGDKLKGVEFMSFVPDLEK